MTECNRKNRLLGKSIRKIRMRRNMTQRELANAIDGISESALRSYELGERRPKQNTLERIAKALDVAPACFDTYGIERYDELVHALFLLEAGSVSNRERMEAFGLPTKQSSHVFAHGVIGRSSWRRGKSQERNTKTGKMVP